MTSHALRIFNIYRSSEALDFLFSSFFFYHQSTIQCIHRSWYLWVENTWWIIHFNFADSHKPTNTFRKNSSDCCCIVCSPSPYRFNRWNVITFSLGNSNAQWFCRYPEIFFPSSPSVHMFYDFQMRNNPFFFIFHQIQKKKRKNKIKRSLYRQMENSWWGRSSCCVCICVLYTRIYI